MSRFDEINCSSGIVAVCTRLPFTSNRISMESGVNAIIYGNAQTIDVGDVFQWKSNSFDLLSSCSFWKWHVSVKSKCVVV